MGFSLRFLSESSKTAVKPNRKRQHHVKPQNVKKPQVALRLSLSLTQYLDWMTQRKTKIPARLSTKLQNTKVTPQLNGLTQNSPYAGQRSIAAGPRSHGGPVCPSQELLEKTHEMKITPSGVWGFQKIKEIAGLDLHSSANRRSISHYLIKRRNTSSP